LSWADELAPMAPTPENLLEDLAAADRLYQKAGVHGVRRVAFLLLRVGQRLAYWGGWMMAKNPRR